MKIVFSVYLEDFETEKKQLKFCEIVETKMTMSQLDKHLQIYDGFRSVLEVGVNIAFWDIYCFFDITNDIIDKIKKIPRDEVHKRGVAEPCVIKLQKFDPGNADTPFFPDGDSYYFYRVSRFELGASALDAIVALIQNDPILVRVLSTIIFELIKNIWSKLCIKLFPGKEYKNKYTKQTLYFSTKKFYRNFELIANINKSDCQIVGLQKIKGNRYKVRVRTIHNECYEIQSTFRGKILQLNLIEDMSSEW